jgi:hypothetical protein
VNPYFKNNQSKKGWQAWLKQCIKHKTLSSTPNTIGKEKKNLVTSAQSKEEAKTANSFPRMSLTYSLREIATLSYHSLAESK